MTAAEKRESFRHFKEKVHSLEIEAVPGALAPRAESRIVRLTQQVGTGSFLLLIVS